MGKTNLKNKFSEINNDVDSSEASSPKSDHLYCVWITAGSYNNFISELGPVRVTHNVL